VIARAEIDLGDGVASEAFDDVDEQPELDAPALHERHAFECGAPPIDVVNVKAVQIKYYAVAVVFILFDLETIFLFIWALGAQPVTGFMLATFAIFVFLLVLILLYVYRAGILEAVTE
jgi:NADH-quinone oxidoreductase subunit A